MRLINFILNVPFTFTSIIPLILSGPYQVKLNKNPFALVCKVRKFWWTFGYLRKARAMTIGYIILMSPRVLKNDLEHEIIHVRQYEQYPFI